MSKIALSELVVELRRELLHAQQQGEKEDLRFQVEDIDLEVHLASSKKAGGKGGVKFWVYTAEAQGELAAETIHKVHLKLKPVPAGGGDTLISDRDEK